MAILFLTTYVQQKEKTIPEEFCGSSTESYCESDKDCIETGCSGEICGNKKDSLIGTCQYKNCFENEKYNLNCKCIDNKCMWN